MLTMIRIKTIKSIYYNIPSIIYSNSKYCKKSYNYFPFKLQLLEHYIGRNFRCCVSLKNVLNDTINLTNNYNNIYKGLRNHNHSIDNLYRDNMWDFLEIQRNSYYTFLNKSIINEVVKINPLIFNKKYKNIKSIIGHTQSTLSKNTIKSINNKELSLLNNIKIKCKFYPTNYLLTPPLSIIPGRDNKSYTSSLYMPVKITLTINNINNNNNKVKKGSIYKKVLIKWVYMGSIPLMTKRGHFIINGGARVVVNGIIRSPGIYFYNNIYKSISLTNTNIDNRAGINTTTIENYNRPYADFIPLRGTWLRIEMDKDKSLWAATKKGPKIPLFLLLLAMGIPLKTILSFLSIKDLPMDTWDKLKDFNRVNNPIKKAWALLATKYLLGNTSSTNKTNYNDLLYNINSPLSEYTNLSNSIENGIKWVYNKFFNPKNYLLSNAGRVFINDKLGLNISTDIQTLTGLDVLYATQYLIEVSKGIKTIDDIDSLKNRRVRTTGEILEILLGIALARIEKSWAIDCNNFLYSLTKNKTNKTNNNNIGNRISDIKISSKAINSVFREFFGSSPLSQFMDSLNPLAEITHKRRLSSMGVGGVTSSNGCLAIRGIHPTHYGRICPVETPEGKNAGLVSSPTIYCKVIDGLFYTPYYPIYKGIVLKSKGMYYLTVNSESNTICASSDLYYTPIGFINNSYKIYNNNNNKESKLNKEYNKEYNNKESYGGLEVPVKIGEEFTLKDRESIEYIGVSPLQMVSIATSLIPFLESDDANRALMGSNMQRQSIPLIKSSRPIVGTGCEARVSSDSGYLSIAKYSGLVTYVSNSKIVVLS